MGTTSGKSPRRQEYDRSGATLRTAAASRPVASPRSTHSDKGGAISMKENETRLGSHLVDLSDLLGQGAFGIVYAGRDATSGTPVAVKKLAIKQEEDGSQALEEIKKYLRIPPHANLVTLLDYHFKDNAFWLVLEYCTDGNMDEYVCRNDPDEDTRFRFMLQCAQGIAHMHGAEYPMVHRDIKPGNIMLSRVKDHLMVKLTDFGLARDSMLATTAHMTTKAGTPGFMAPEILEEKPYDASVDVFALGLVFLALVNHKKGEEVLKPRIEGGPGVIPVAMQMIMATRAKQKPPIVAAVNKQDNAKLKTVKSIVNKMVVYDPNRRISAAEAARTLESVVGSGDIVVLPASRTSEEPDAKALVALRREARGADSDTGSRASMTPGKMLLQEILRDRVREKAVEEARVDGVAMLAQLLEDMPVMQMLAYALHSDSDDTKDSGGHSSQHFSVGERVRIEADEDTAKELQEGHGGWADGMRRYLGKVGVIKRKVLHVFEVEFDNGQTWNYNPSLLHKLDGSSPEISSNSVIDYPDSRFKGDDVVVICEDEDKLKRLQKGHGGWADSMAKCLGLKAIVHKVDSDGDVYVECINQDKWTFHPDALELADTDSTAIRTGSLVLVVDDYETVRDLQDDRHGAWNEAMRKVLGKAGTVKELVTCDCVKVEFGERTWTMNTKALKHVATEGEMIAAVLRKTLGLNQLRQDEYWHRSNK